MKPQLPSFEQLLPFLSRIDVSNVYSNYGPLSWELRVAYSKYLSVEPERIVPLTNATLAIQGCLEILEQKRWIIPDYTFAATAHAVVNAKKNVYVADVQKDNYQLEIPPDVDVKEFGIVPVLPFGAPIVFNDWQGVDSLVIDAAASLGANPPNFSEMPKNSMVVYSLHATKVLGAGEGAIVVCQNEFLARKLRAWSNFGFDGSRESDTCGTNAKISEYSCAVALASIANLQEERREWERIHKYIQSLNYPRSLRTIVDDYPGFRPYWIIEARDLDQKLNLVHFLSELGIETRSWWGTPITQMPAFKNLEKLAECPNSKKLSEKHLGLPIWKGIQESELQYIASSLRNFFA